MREISKNYPYTIYLNHKNKKLKLFLFLKSIKIHPKNQFK